ncbi:RNA degradosome polyphosphate kinase [Jeotgalibaca porci]|uniref:Polyphosphate kinase n=1 Tax=Jeotgalibaca porci TaxID=1868793 RepID=A0A6G7WJH3_9LACT|nr:RNA degradosome polyphosphate kinase [Jeotgalibaca porci]NLB99417.1 RNA degradosome polyphosphate kinase [Lactobacillales bacterium]QIK52318.1 RNA degradosome polyphosphate kinase [Jeotgalibaca porci]
MDDLHLNLENPAYYFNRELSWLEFNKRVIQEADISENPLLEQINFLAIGSSNLDEFFMIRVAGLQDQLQFDPGSRDSKTQLNAEEQLEEIARKNRQNITLQYDLLDKRKEDLKKYEVHFTNLSELTDSELAEVTEYYDTLIFPALTPLGIDAYHPFPRLNNKVMHLFVSLTKDEEKHTAVIPISNFLERFYLLETEETVKVVLLEEIIQANIHRLFNGYDVLDSFTFRITRNADFDVQEEGAEDLLSVIEDYLKRRKNGVAVRLEVEETQPQNVTLLRDALGLLERDVYQISGPLDLTLLAKLADKLEERFPDLRYPSFTPIIPNELLSEPIYALADRQDIFLHHPYDSFRPVLDFIEEACRDENTLAIKQTLYRVSKDSPIVKALKTAAESGIQVTVLVELKARFDEENNVHWAKELEDSGAHVLYGVTELKTHSKITLVVKKEGTQLKRYVHLGTGNYNDKTARGYEDMGIITTQSEIGEDATEFFNYLSGFSKVPKYRQLYVSPYEIRLSFFEHIEKEMAFHQAFGNGHIIAKMNSLTDKKIIKKLYEASMMGVKIDLIIRGICCLKPGIIGISENIRVMSIIGRYLEHSRVYYFHQNGAKKLFLSSADMMTRNMINRVEIEFPILDEKIKNEILTILDVYLNDNQKAQELHKDGHYVPIINSEEPLHAQKKFVQWAREE